jgi:hypothetical protein
VESTLLGVSIGEMDSEQLSPISAIVNLESYRGAHTLFTVILNLSQLNESRKPFVPKIKIKLKFKK